MLAVPENGQEADPCVLDSDDLRPADDEPARAQPAHGDHLRWTGRFWVVAGLVAPSHDQPR